MECVGYIFFSGWRDRGVTDYVQDAVKEQFRYVCVGSLDDPEALPPKGEFFCGSRASWMPEIPSECTCASYLLEVLLTS